MFKHDTSHRLRTELRQPSVIQVKPLIVALHHNNIGDQAIDDWANEQSILHAEKEHQHVSEGIDNKGG